MGLQELTNRVATLEALLMSHEGKVIPMQLTGEQAARILFNAGKELGLAEQYNEPTEAEKEQFKLWINTIIKYIPCYQVLPT
jgi:hypothetical protein